MDINVALIDGYLRMLDNLSPNEKLDLISKLTKSIKADLTGKKKRFNRAFGAWDSNESAYEIIADIQKSRRFNRQVEGF